ncbi:MAG: acyl-CoA dehydrogenase [Deltaproteobacteria bacterium]|nr:acyl-CoA dehydrogenase [Deltaproteobacteria bacterium]
MSENSHYKIDLRDIEFELFEHFKLAQLFESEPYSHFSEEDARMIIKEAHTFATEVMAPSYSDSDREGCSLANGKVKVPAAFQDIWKKYYENGWNMLDTSTEHDGQGAPHLLAGVVTEMMSGANTAFAMYPGLSMGAAEVIRSFGTPEQQELFATRIENGTWAGTMVLTEANAGSDLGVLTTKAVPNDDGSYSVTGNKIFISGGDQDITENIIHLVLARIEGAPKGTRGLSLFIIPKVRVNPDGSLGEPNDVTCTGIEHKLGINASATAALAFGENGGCQGFLVGGEPAPGTPPGDGIRKMFLMMNIARIGVGVQALAVASTAYLNALEYTRTRLQGPSLSEGRPPEGAVPIIKHPDVRRMLLDMKARVEGCRALLFHAMRLVDEEKIAGEDDGEGYSSLFIPMVKAHLSDTAMNVTSTAIQCFGGAGYTRDYPAEQYYRDCRIFPIYEGTNGIQALDLVGRKLASRGGSLVNRLIEEQGALLEQMESWSDWGEECDTLKRGMESLSSVVGKFTMKGMSGDIEGVAIHATPFLEALSTLIISRLLAEGANVAQQALDGVAADSQDAEFYKGKISTARYYLRNILPHGITALDVMMNDDLTALEISEKGFSLAF